MNRDSHNCLLYYPTQIKCRSKIKDYIIVTHRDPAGIFPFATPLMTDQSFLSTKTTCSIIPIVILARPIFRLNGRITGQKEKSEIGFQLAPNAQVVLCFV